jgi:hypothetical protein
MGLEKIAYLKGDATNPNVEENKIIAHIWHRPI